MDWSGVYYCDVFISCLDSHSDGTHSLQSIHWWTSDAILHFSMCFDEKQILLYLGWTEAQCTLSTFYFWGVNYSFKCLFTPLTHFKSTFLNSRKQVKTFISDITLGKISQTYPAFFQIVHEYGKPEASYPWTCESNIRKTFHSTYTWFL